jgi:hypothetical protein
MECPKCKADHAHRSHRHGPAEWLASLFACYPYRCNACQHRFLRFRYTSPATIEANEGSAARLIRASRASRQWRRKRREFLLYGAAVLFFLAFLYYITRERPPAPDGG